MPVFLDLDGLNVGFKHWHPTPVIQNGDQLAGQGELGGAWEWTSTPLAPHHGFKAMDIYPGYTCKHQSHNRVPSKDRSLFTNATQPISSTVNTTSSWVVLGLLIPALLGVPLCKFTSIGSGATIRF